MKKYIYILLILSTTFSCSNFLNEENKSNILAETFYSSPAELELAVHPIYLDMVYMYDNDRVMCANLGGDDVTTSPALADFQSFDLFNTTGANVTMTRDWKYAYETISWANGLLNKYQSANATETQKNNAAGQAYFARAWTYYHLVRTFNKIPLIIDLESHPDIKKSEPSVIYNQIIEDLKKAEAMLPDGWTDYKAKMGFTRGAAKAALASVYLTMAGYPVKDVSKYSLAAEKAKEVIDNASTWGFNLLPNFADLWVPARFNSETVIGLYYNVDNGQGSQRAPYSSYPSDFSGWDVYFAELNFYKAFPAGPRKDATFWTSFKYKNSDGTIVTKDWTQLKMKHPYYKKYVAIDGSNWDTPWEYVNWESSRTNVLMRYAEVLLVYAEAKAMSGAPDATAYTAINQVRTRAGLPNLTAGLSQAAFRDAVIAERAWEFAGLEPNGSRWFDLVRTEGVEAAAANRDPSETAIFKQPTKANYFAPIPDSEILLNPNLAN